ncbi:hypothetical protein [Sandaracinus amylolyticus]|uniref:hypothetical protein n=1 Tax=Sandaracinus amylolyticus TaxID=927083 RepID=UPI001F40C030|nr:hypothetical protein [Sandaracinus amylolyticus]UJR84196.1 Hypothetical protein I5071_62670 [Sandaracinus amylolyticus]
MIRTDRAHVVVGLVLAAAFWCSASDRARADGWDLTIDLATETRIEARDDGTSEEKDERIWWFGPSVGFDGVVYDFALGRVAEFSFTPSAGLGFRWNPFTTETWLPQFLAADLYFRLAVDNTVDNAPVPLDIVLTLTVTFIRVGFGIRVLFPTVDGSETEAHGLMTLGIALPTSS